MRKNEEIRQRILICAGGLALFLMIFLFLKNKKPKREMWKPPVATTTPRATEQRASSPRGKRVVSVRRGESGVFYIPAEINGVKLDFCFDTGASSVSISKMELALLIKQGKFDPQRDVLGEGKASIADGSVVPITIVVLREVTIAGRTLKDVEASVDEHLAAPLLLGQSVLSKFGRFTFDYNNDQVIFED